MQIWYFPRPHKKVEIFKCIIQNILLSVYNNFVLANYYLGSTSSVVTSKLEIKESMLILINVVSNRR